MARKAVRASKPPLAAICAAFVAGHRVSFTAQGPTREREPFTERQFKIAMGAMSAKRTQSTEVLNWMQARGMVDQHRPGYAFMLTRKGAHVTDRACSVLARRRR
jgi:hypothetical protein